MFNITREKRIVKREVRESALLDAIEGGNPQANLSKNFITTLGKVLNCPYYKNYISLQR